MLFDVMSSVIELYMKKIIHKHIGACINSLHHFADFFSMKLNNMQSTHIIIVTACSS